MTDRMTKTHPPAADALGDLLSQMDSVGISGGRTITIECEDTVATGKLFAFFQAALAHPATPDRDAVRNATLDEVAALWDEYSSAETYPARDIVAAIVALKAKAQPDAGEGA